MRTLVTVGCSVVLALAVSLRARTTADAEARDLQPFVNDSGVHQTISTNGAFSPDNPFFQSLGNNGRSCGSCHQAATGWTVTPASIQARFAATQGEDPIFRTNDGATCPSDDVTTVDARRQAYSMLLSKGLIRVGIGIPAAAKFTLVDIDDPYNCATPAELSLFRRPLPATNLRFLTTIMLDGREPSLEHQAQDATAGHAQGSVPLTNEEVSQIVALESGLTTAQTIDRSAGRLDQHGGLGGPVDLSTQPFFIGINDPLGPPLSFDPRAFSLFTAWMSSVVDARSSIARGEEIFNTRTIDITGVAGLNDKPGLTSIPGTCTTCHNTPNVGNHSVPLALDIGISAESRRTPDMPLYTLRCNATGQVVRTMDPGKALITGNCEDIGKTKGPILRGLASRSPYFHNGSAATLMDVVEFYDQRFNLGLTAQEKADLVAFLKTL